MPKNIQRLHVIYIPGIGDANPTSQIWAVSKWKYWGVDSELLQMNWHDNEPWPKKLDKITARIDRLKSESKLVALVGASAGASAAINAYAARKDDVIGLVTIAGKINNPQSIGPRYRQNNPAFVESAYQCEQSLKKLNEADLKKVLCRYAVFDEVIARQDSVIQGAKNQMIPTLGHAITIAIQITLGAPSFIRFLKKQV